MAQRQDNVELIIQKIFTLDASFESPNSPNVFKNQWAPEANIDLNTESEKLEDDTHLVTLTVTVTAKTKDQHAFVVEVKQAGIFTIKGGDKETVSSVLGAYCPSTLFPYAREAISSLVNRGGFPQLSLAPINFDALYMQGLEHESKGKKAKSKAH